MYDLNGKTKLFLRAIMIFCGHFYIIFKKIVKIFFSKM